MVLILALLFGIRVAGVEFAPKDLIFAAAEPRSRAIADGSLPEGCKWAFVAETRIAKRDDEKSCIRYFYKTTVSLEQSCDRRGARVRVARHDDGEHRPLRRAARVLRHVAIRPAFRIETNEPAVRGEPVLATARFEKIVHTGMRKAMLGAEVPERVSVNCERPPAVQNHRNPRESLTMRWTSLWTRPSAVV